METEQEEKASERRGPPWYKHYHLPTARSRRQESHIAAAAAMRVTTGISSAARDVKLWFSKNRVSPLKNVVFGFLFKLWCHLNSNSSVLSGELPPAMGKTALFYHSGGSSGYESMLRDSSENTEGTSSAQDSLNEHSSATTSSRRSSKSSKKSRNNTGHIYTYIQLLFHRARRGGGDHLQSFNWDVAFLNLDLEIFENSQKLCLQFMTSHPPFGSKTLDSKSTYQNK